MSTVDEGIEVLTGDLREDGSYPQGTVRYLVEQRLDDMTRRARDSGKGNESDANGGNEKDADDR